MIAAYWALFLTALGVILLVAELMLPTHGLLGVMGLASFGGAIGACFYINQWLGLGVFLGSALAAPFVAAGVIRLWPRTPVGRRLLLPENPSLVRPPPVEVGQVGVVVSDLRPMGECDFGQVRIEAVSEYGIIPAGQPVKVAALDDGRIVVRPVSSAVPTATSNG